MRLTYPSNRWVSFIAGDVALQTVFTASFRSPAALAHGGGRAGSAKAMKTTKSSQHRDASLFMRQTPLTICDEADGCTESHCVACHSTKSHEKTPKLSDYSFRSVGTALSCPPNRCVLGRTGGQGKTLPTLQSAANRRSPMSSRYYSIIGLHEIRSVYYMNARDAYQNYSCQAQEIVPEVLEGFGINWCHHNQLVSPVVTDQT